MACIHREIEVRQSPEVVWEVIRDVGQIHKRLVPGFVIDCRLEGDSRFLTFGNGMQVEEVILSVDDQRRRHSWSAKGEPLTHYNASIQVFPADAGCRLIWIADLMPNEAAGPIGEMIEQGLAVMKTTLES